MRPVAMAFLALFLSIPSTFAQTYDVGDLRPGGGLIVYVSGNATSGWRYLEAAPEDEQNSVWSNVEADLGTTKARWGAGEGNTRAIIGQKGHTKSAAKVCHDKGWFLPSVRELEMVYLNLKVKGFDEFKRLPYWSSHESSTYLPGDGEKAIRPVAYDFRTGSPTHALTKGASAVFRCVRFFEERVDSVTASYELSD